MENWYKNKWLVGISGLAVGAVLGVALLVYGFNYHSPNRHLLESEPEPQEISVGEEIWTCSMHPQIRQNEPGICPICEMDLIPLEANTSNDPLVLEMTSEAVKLAHIQTSIVGEERTSAAKTIRLSGKVQADERLASTQVAHVPGRIEKLYVTFTGEAVKKGQRLAEVYSPDLITAQRELLEAVKLTDVSPELASAARKKLQNWKLSAESIEAIESDGDIQETFTIYADMNGVVTERRVAVGDYVQGGEPLFDLINLQRVWVLFDAYEEDLAHVAVGDQVVFTTPALSGQEFQARITFIDPFIDPQTRVAELRAELNNPGQLLKPEMLVAGTLMAASSTNAKLSIPKSAVLWTGSRSVVYVKQPNTNIPSFEFREVQLGEALGERYVIRNGLTAGEEVVTYGSFVIDAAAQLNNQASMMNQEVVQKGVVVDESIPNFTAETPASFQDQLVKMVETYLALKDALVASDPESSQRTATKLLEDLQAINMSLLEGEAHQFWMTKRNALESHGAQIAESEELEEQREQFDFLSQALIESARAFGVSDKQYYIQHCPMANNDEGADWLSDEKEIKNPYFGDRMLRCGIVEDTLVTR